MSTQAPLEIVRLEESQIDEAAAMLARCFGDDALQTYLFPEAEERAAKSAALFGALIRYGMRFGQVWTTPREPKAIGVWLPPGQWEITQERAIEGGLHLLPALIGEAAAARFLQSAAYVGQYHHTDPPAAHWYGLLGGVAPEAQGRFLGFGLLKPIVQQADEAGVHCYVEVNDTNTLTLYTRGCGFRVLREFVEPSSGIKFWTLLRDPRTGEHAGSVRRIRQVATGGAGISSVRLQPD